MNQPDHSTDPQDRQPDHLPIPADGEVAAWEQLESGRFMPRRIRGSDRGRKLG